VRYDTEYVYCGAARACASTIEDADDTGYVFGNNRGIVFIDTAFATAPPPQARQPQSWRDRTWCKPKLRLGSQFAASVAGSSATQIQATTPAMAPLTWTNRQPLPPSEL